MGAAFVTVTPRACGSSGALTTGENWYRAYGFDDFGNRWVSADDGISDHPLMPTSASAFNVANNRPQGSNFTTDEAGRLTKYGAWDLVHDDEGHLWELTHNVSGQQNLTRYRYDANGRRVMRYAPGATNPVVYVYL
jgi:YD repeat-containing protein